MLHRLNNSSAGGDASSKRNPLRLLDYEYSGYNYRGHDFANLFSEFVIDYSTSEFPGFQIYEDDFPSEDKMTLFFSHYIQHLQEHELATRTSEESTSQKEVLHGSKLSPDIDSLINETKAMVPAVHLLWALWCLVMFRAKAMPTSDGNLQVPEFGFLQYGKARARLYKKAK